MKRAFTYAICIIFMYFGVRIGINLGHVVWSWFNGSPGTVEVWRHAGGVLTTTVQTTTNPIWDVMCGFFGLAGGAVVGGLVGVTLDSAWKKLSG